MDNTTQKRSETVARLFAIRYPIIQGGMIWAASGKLAAAVSNAGGLGLIGGGSMNQELFLLHLKKARALTAKPFGVNIPLLFKHSEDLIKVSLDFGVNIFFTSAGSPKRSAKFLKDQGATVVHVVSTPAFAKKCEDAGCDAVVAEGFEAGGHNGRDELTTMVLIPQTVDAVNIPVIAAGGIADHRGVRAAMALGAAGVQVGSRFAASQESSLHDNFKNAIVNASATDTILALKKVIPVRMIKNKFAREALACEERGASQEELAALLGHGRSKKGMFEGDLEEGELEIGQIAGMIKSILPVEEIVKELAQGLD